MLGGLAYVAREARLDAGATQLDVATRAGVSHETISRFERGGQPQKLDEIVTAYEAECGLARDALWERAVRRARRRGGGGSPAP